MAEKQLVEGLKWVRSEIATTLRPVRDIADAVDASPDLAAAVSALDQVHGVLLALRLPIPAQLVEAMRLLAEGLRDGQLSGEAVIMLLGEALTRLSQHLDRLEDGINESPLRLWSIINDVRAAGGKPPLSQSELLSLAATTANSQMTPDALTLLAEEVRRVRPQYHRYLVAWYRGDPDNLSLAHLESLFHHLRDTFRDGIFADLFQLAGLFAGALRDGRLPTHPPTRTLMGHLDWVLKPLSLQPPQHPDADALSVIGHLIKVLTEGGIHSSEVAPLQSWYGSDDAGLFPALEMEPDNTARTELAMTLLGEFAQLKTDFDRLACAEQMDQATLDRFSDQLQGLSKTLDMTATDELSQRLHALADDFSGLTLDAINQAPGQLESHAMELLEIESLLLAQAGSRARQRSAPALDFSELTAATLREAGYELVRVKEAIANCHFEQMPAALMPVRQYLASIAGALTVLGELPAAQLAGMIGELVQQRYVKPGHTPADSEFEHLADAVAALELFIGHLQEPVPFGASFIERGAQAIATLQSVPDATLKSLHLEIKSKPPVAPVLDVFMATGAPPDSRLTLDSVIHLDLSDSREAQTPARSIDEELSGLHESASEQSRDDTEFLDIFLEEAREETTSAQIQFARWKSDPQDASALATLRRSFHTLKGSGRLVGALQVAEFAQAIEFLLNRLIEEQFLPSDEILDCVADAVRLLPDLLAAESEGHEFDTMAVVAHVNQLRAMPRLEIAAAPEGEISSAASARMPEQPDADLLARVTDHDSLFADDDELLHIFQDETHEHLAELHAFLQRADAGDAHIDDALQRALHTLTGSARMAGIDSIAIVTKGLEQSIKPLLASADALDDVRLDLLRRVINGVRARVEELPELGAGAVALIALADEIAQLPSPTPRVLEPDISDHSIADIADALMPPDLAGLAVVAGAEDTALDSPATSADAVAEVSEEPGALDMTLFLELPEDSAIVAPAAAVIVGETGETAHPLAFPDTSEETAVTEERITGSAVVDERLTAVPALTITTEPLATDTQSLERAVTEPSLALPGESGDAMPPPDPELAALFLEDARDLLDNLDTQFRAWQSNPQDLGTLDGINRLLHTLKGSARLTGLRSIGDLSHALETRLKSLSEDQEDVSATTLELTQRAVDSLSSQVDALAQGALVPRMTGLIATLAQGSPDVASEITVTDLPPGSHNGADAFADLVKASKETLLAETGATESGAAVPASPQIRVRSDLLNRLVNHAGEISIYRGRLTQRNGLLGFGLGELDQTVVRLRDQLRLLEIETQTQIMNRFERDGDATEYDGEFDPLELDRFSRLQQLSGSLAETVNDLVSVKEMLGGYQREFTDLLTQQARLADDLQDGLLRTRLVPFVQVVPRLHRLVRQTADTLGKSARLEVIEPEVELDRTILDRLVAPLEHLLRNAVDHGLEDPETRRAHDKPAMGTVTLALHREGNDAVISLSDDGRGLDLAAIRQQAIKRGLLAPDTVLPDEALLQFILEPGFTTSGQVTQISGRGVGLDVVASEIKAANGSIALESVPGQGARFTIRLPLTLAIIDAFLVAVGDNIYAVPHSTVEAAARIGRNELLAIYRGEASDFILRDQRYKLVYLGGVLDPRQEPELGERRWLPLLLIRLGEQRVALHVDSLLESQRILVKPLGPQLAGVRWLSGGTILPDGRVALILDALALLRSGAVQVYQPTGVAAETVKVQTCVMVVDDSLTVRRVTSRLLRRQNMEVLTAKDGVEALTLLDERLPDLMLLDIEMPRMDGYELTRHIRRSEGLRDLPIIMITSRTGAKHRDYAMQLGVNRYLGKPYQESELLQQINSVLEER